MVQYNNNLGGLEQSGGGGLFGEIENICFLS